MGDVPIPTVASMGTVGGVAALVLLIVQAIKGSWPKRYVAHIAVLLGVALGTLGAFALHAAGGPTFAEVYQGALTGAAGGAVACALYAVQKPTGIMGPRS